MVMMRHASSDQPLVARQQTVTQRIFASANDCLMPVTVNMTAEHGGQQPLQSRLLAVSRQLSEYLVSTRR
jgi:hypothetical protein